MNQCQDYTYTKEGKYNFNNQVISEYLQRTLVQIKAAQDEMLADHAEDCLNDVASCLQQNNSSSYYYSSTSTYEDISDVAINACKSQIKTCMSTMGETIPTGTNIVPPLKTWLENALSAKTSPVNQIKFVLNGNADAILATAQYKDYVVDGYDYTLLKIPEFLDNPKDSSSMYWCFKTTEVGGITNFNIADGVACAEIKNNADNTLKAKNLADFITNGATFYLSQKKSKSDCTSASKTWNGAACVD